MKKKFLLILGILFLFLFAAAIGMHVFLEENSTLVENTGISTREQNYAIAYDDATNLLYLGTRSGRLLAYDADTYALQWESALPAQKPINDIVVRSDLGRIYLGSDDGSIHILRQETGAIEHSLEVQRRIMDLDVSADGTRVVAATKSNSKSNVLVYDLATDEELSNVKYSYLIKKVLFASDMQSIITTDRRGQFCIITPEGEELVTNRKVLNTEIYALERTADGCYFAADNEGAYGIFREDGTVVRSGHAPMIKGANVRSGSIDAAGRVILGTEQGFVYILNEAGELLYDYQQAQGMAVTSLACSGTRIFLTGWGDFVETIELAKLETITALQSSAMLFQVLLYISAAVVLVCLLLYFGWTYNLLRRIQRSFWKHKLAYLLLVPTFTLLILFNYIPAFVAMFRAFTNWSSKNFFAADIRFVGLDNFKRMFTEGYFLVGVKNMLILMLTGFVKTMTMPLLAAWLVYSFRRYRKKSIFRFLFVLPIVVPGLVSALLWKQIYNPGGGLDQILTALGLENLIHVWLGEEKTAIWAIVFMGPPYIGAMPFLLYYGGLSSIDQNLYEAAKIDGATRWNVFWKIQIPMIKPQMKLLLMLQFISSIQDYSSIYLLTGGGPRTATYTPGLELYYNATTFGNYGYACAMGVTMFVFILAGTLIGNRIKAENYGS